MSAPSPGNSAFAPLFSPQHSYVVDSSIGRRITQALKQTGWDVRTVAELFGVSENTRIADPDVIRRAAEDGLAWVTADELSRIVHAEAITRHRISVLWLHRPHGRMRRFYMLAVASAALGHFDCRLTNSGDRTVLCEARTPLKDTLEDASSAALPSRSRRIR